jgi:hypothetical protein
MPNNRATEEPFGPVLVASDNGYYVKLAGIGHFTMVFLALSAQRPRESVPPAADARRSLPRSQI